MTNQEKVNIIYEMLSELKKEHNRLNTSLFESGEGKYCSPFEHVEVQDIKDYAIKLLVDEKLVDL